MSLALSSGLDNSTEQPRSRIHPAGWSQPSPSPSYIYAVNDNCSTIDYGLTDLARCLSVLDFKLIKKAKKVELKAKKQAEEEGNAAKAAVIGDRIYQLTRLDTESNNGAKAIPRFSSTYLTDEQFGPIWKRYLKSIKAIVNSKAAMERATRIHARDTLHDYAAHGLKLRVALVEAARADLLNRSILSAVGDRWIQLQEAISFYHKVSDVKGLKRELDPEPILAWEYIMKDIQITAPTEILIQSDGQRALGWITLDAMSAWNMNLSRDIRLSWSSIFFLLMTVVSVAFFSIGYGKSTHQRGTTADAGFWFSAQASIAQLTGIAGSVMLEWYNHKVPKRRWKFLCGTAVSASLLATPIYVLAPTEWSTFLTTTVTMVQSILIIQRFIFETKE